MAQIVVPDGTPIKIRLNEPLSSARNHVGQGVNLSVAEDVTIGEKIVIEAGSRVTGIVTVAESKRSMGRAGKLDFTPEKIQLPEGKLVAVRATPQNFKGRGKGVTTGVVTAGLAVAFWPAAPFALMIKGKDVEIPTGVTFSSFTDAKFVFNEAALARAAKPEKEGPLAALAIASDVDGADIEIDGKFVGQTPATMNLPAGDHRVVVRYKGMAWERLLQLSAGNNVNLKAQFPTADVAKLQP